MMPNADNDFLLGLAGVSGTMLGTFIVGVFCRASDFVAGPVACGPDL